MWIVFFYVLYIIIAGIIGRVFLHIICGGDYSYNNDHKALLSVVFGLFWPLTLPCFIIVEILTISKKD